MAAVVHAKTVAGKKLFYVYGARGNEKWEKHYPTCRSKGELYGILTAELGLPTTTPRTDVVFTLMHKTWNGSQWLDDFSVQLRRLREQAGYTQAHLAEKSGLSVQAIAAIEQGTRLPNWDTARRLARVLEVSIDEFTIEPPDDPEADKQ